MKRTLLLVLLLACIGVSAFGQNTVNSQLFGAGWNDISPGGSPTKPSPWCPVDGNGTAATITSFRLWDDGVKWYQVQSTASSPTDTTGYTFTKFDWAMGSNVATKPGCNMKMLYQFGATPKFATACSAAGDPSTCLPGKITAGFGGGSQCSNASDYSCLPPIDLNGDGTGADAWWINYVGQVALRYSGKTGSKGHMSYWGTWNEADSPNFWCIQGGTVPCGGSTPSLKNLVLMAWDMYQVTKCIDPASLVISPDGHVGTMLTWFHNFATTSISAPARSITITPPAGSSYSGISCSWGARTVTGKQTFDVVDEHMRGTNSTNSDPTAIIAAYNAAKTEMANDGMLTYPLWNDEYGYNGTAQAANVQIQAGYISVGLVLEASFNSPNIQQGNWYLWDDNSGPPSQTIVGTAWDVTADWLLGSTVNNFTQAGTIYSVTGTTAGGTSFKVTWDTSKTCSGTPVTCATSTQTESGMTHYVDVAGVTHSISGTAPVGWQPIFLTGAGGGSIAVAPTFSPDPTGSPYSTAQNVTIATTSTGAIICYTTNGTTPATNGTTGCTTGTLYSGAITTSVGTNYKAVAGGTGFTDSTVATATYTFAASQPLLTPCCTFTGAVSVTMTIPAAPAGAFICFTTDGTRPTSDGAGNCTNGTRYSSPVSVATSQTIEAISANNGWIDNGPVIFIYHINYNLSVSVSGSGQVDSSPTGINACSAIGGVCSSAFPQGTSVTLTGAAGSGYTFIGWSGGGCIGTTPCTIALNSTTSVTATFAITTPQVSTGILHGVMLN